ncbi:MAG: hypothetical protein HFG48_00945 [Bacilli bacterium]|nr:hypothetical protein [Bacilli bacterium]
MLKKFLLLFFVLILLCSNVFAISKSNKSTYNLEKRNYYIDISKEAVTTNNINNIFENMKILKLYPLVNLKIEDKRVVSKIFNISFTDVNTYIENYINCLSELGFYEDAEKVLVSGIKINVIYVEASNSQIDDFLLRFPNAKLLKKLDNFVFNFS